MILSILIPTLPQRQYLLRRMRADLTNFDDVEVLVDDRQGVPTGTKRNDLIARAKGQYVVFIDDDDRVPQYYVEELNTAAHNHNKDCITFRGYMTTNGASRVNFVLRLGEKYEERGGVYYRWPNHITPIKRSIAQQVKFPPVYQGEDYAWSKEINDRGLIKTEYFIDKEMYHYDYRTNK